MTGNKPNTRSTRNRKMSIEKVVQGPAKTTTKVKEEDGGERGRVVAADNGKAAPVVTSGKLQRKHPPSSSKTAAAATETAIKKEEVDDEETEDEEEDDGPTPTTAATNTPTTATEATTTSPNECPSSATPKAAAAATTPSPISDDSDEDPNANANAQQPPQKDQQQASPAPPPTPSAAQPQPPTPASAPSSAAAQRSLPESQGYSQTDEHIRRLEHEGALTEVVGSQSILSQELKCCSQRTLDEDSQEGVHALMQQSVSRKLDLLSQESTNIGLNTQDRIKLATMSQQSMLGQLESYHITDSQTQSQLRRRIEREFAASQSPMKLEEGSQGMAGLRATGESQIAMSPIKRFTATLSQLDGISLSQTSQSSPLRDIEGFQPLLDAVQVVTEREEMNSRMQDSAPSPGKKLDELLEREQESSMSSLSTAAAAAAAADAAAEAAARSKAGATSKSGTKRSAALTKMEAESEQATAAALKKRKVDATMPAVATSSFPASMPSYKRGRMLPTWKKKQVQLQSAQAAAERAAKLAAQITKDPDMAKKLLLSMALVRVNPRTAPSVWPAKGSVIPEGFFWAHYPPLEGVLKNDMAQYYELSTTRCQSAQQQSFNNNLVLLIRDEAAKQCWTFDAFFSDKVLRDRIRCYYKTHIQNAKKRLRTMVKNPRKKANARHLCAHLDLIEKHQAEQEAAQQSEASQTPLDGTSGAEAKQEGGYPFPNPSIDVKANGDGDANGGIKVIKMRAPIQAKYSISSEDDDASPKKKRKAAPTSARTTVVAQAVTPSPQPAAKPDATASPPPAITAASLPAAAATTTVWITTTTTTAAATVTPLSSSPPNFKPSMLLTKPSNMSKADDEQPQKDAAMTVAVKREESAATTVKREEPTATTVKTEETTVKNEAETLANVNISSVSQRAAAAVIPKRTTRSRAATLMQQPDRIESV